jgi:hypothetical protein
MIALIEELTFDKAEADKVKAMAHAERRYSTGKGFYYPGFEVERAGFDDGDYVTHVDCESLRPNRCEVLGKTSDGRYEIECPGPEGVGTETLIANRNELRAY